MDKNANFGPNLDGFGQKVLIFTGEIKSFVTHITKKQPRHLVGIGFWSGMGKNGQIMPIFGPKCIFWTNFGRFWAKNLIFYGSK